MGITVREAVPTDNAAIAELRRAVYTHVVTTADTIGWLTENEPVETRARRLVAELDGRVVGAVRAGVDIESSEPGHGLVELAVHPLARCSGAGSVLLSEAEGHLRAVGATRALTWVSDDGPSRSFAARRDYRPGRTLRILRLDLRTQRLPAPASSIRDVEIVAASCFAENPRSLYELDAECAGDEPNDGPVEPVGYETWLALYWGHPCLDGHLSSVVLADGVPASFSLAYTDGSDRYFSGMAGTRREFRGRGLAKLAKGHSLRRAERAGYADAYGTNDTSNAPMLAINEWFGYRTGAVEHRCVRELRPGVFG